MLQLEVLNETLAILFMVFLSIVNNYEKERTKNKGK